MPETPFYTETSPETPTLTPTPTSTQECNICFRMACESSCFIVPTPTSTPILTNTPTSTLLSFTPTPTPTLTPTSTPTLTPTPTSTGIQNLLFKKSSWSGTIGSPWLSYVDQAADRWNTYIKFNPSVRSSIQGLVSGWDGIQLEPGQFSIVNDSESGVIASCGVYGYVQISGKQYNTVSFTLEINQYYENVYSESDWVNILTHELGHALGIGIYWDSYFSGATPPQDYFLDGTVYTNTQNSYDSITSLSRAKTPLENSGGVGTQSAHWENNFRPSSDPGTGGVAYSGLSNELMVGSIGPGSTRILSQLSIQNLVDFGYMEVNPGSSEGSPTTIPSIVSGIASGIHNKLNCKNPKHMVKLGEIELS